MTSAQAALRMRADLLERANYACESCEATDVELQVHHRYYNSQSYNGEYPIDSLEVLCVPCHGKADGLRRRLCKSIGKMHEAISMRALGYMEAIVLEDEWEHPSESIELRSWEHADGVGDVFGLDADSVIGLADPGRRVTLGQLVHASTERRHQHVKGELIEKGLIP